MKKNLYLFQPHQSFEFNNKKSYWLPYSVGCLWSYAQQNSVVNEHYNLDGLFFKRSKINDVLEEMTDPAIAAFSCYVWNWQYNIKMAKAIKQRWPNCLIVFGGPQVTKRPYENSFFKKHPYIDTIINGEGEIAFENLLIDVLNNQTPKKVISFTRLSDLNYPSPYVSGVFDKIIQDNPDVGWQMVIETNRGCPYSCTFCDWNSGLTNKVSRRREMFKDEADLFHRIGFQEINLTDANAGQYDEDVELVKYFAKKNLEDNADMRLIVNFSKLKKENNLKIYHELARGKLSPVIIVSIQDINEQVLLNIDRPSLTWDENKQIMQDLNDNYPAMAPVVQFIQGLPGQTPETWKTTLSEISKFRCLPYPFLSELLVASPAYYDPTYQERFNFVYSDSTRYNINSGFFQHKFPESCVSFSKEDMVTMTLYSTIYMLFGRYDIFYDSLGDQKNYYADKFIESDMFKILYENLYNNWSKEDKFYYTINLDGSEDIITACNFFKTTDKWLEAPKFYEFMYKIKERLIKDIKKFHELYEKKVPTQPF